MPHAPCPRRAWLVVTARVFDARVYPGLVPGCEKLVDQNHAESQRTQVQSNTVHDQLAEDGLSNADLLVSIRKKSNREVKGKVTLGTHIAKSHICEEVLPIAAVIIQDAIRLYSNNQAPVISPMISTTRFSQLHRLHPQF